MTVEVTLMFRAIDYALSLLGIREDRSKNEKIIQRRFVEVFRKALILSFEL